MKTISTAKEFLESKVFNKTSDQISKIMIEFTKLHVEAALDRAYYNQGMSWTNSTKEESKKELFFCNSYPLNKIK